MSEDSTSGASTKAELLYTWKYKHGVDNKRRIQIPAKWRESEKEAKFEMVLWPFGMMSDACVMVFPHDRWMTLALKLKDSKWMDPQTEVLRRVFGGNSFPADMDKAGRICIPEEMMEPAAIGTEVLLVGLLDRFQIWDPRRWEDVKRHDAVEHAEAFKQA